MEFQAVQHTIDKLIQWIRSGRLALPDFQRDFVWNPGRVVELLDSVARQWPVGSLLLLSGPQPFGIRAIADAPALKGSNLDFYVLDGQQRLTSLYHAISDVSDFCYFVDFSALANDSEDYIKWEKREVFHKRYGSLDARASAHIALIKDVWDFDAFYAWVEKLPDHRLQRQYVSLRERRLGGLQAKVYKLMAIELDQEIQVEALARIFETLNRTGIRLNAFDLMVAMLYPTGFHLRDKWEEAKLEFDVLDVFDVDPIEVLKLSALLIRRSEGKKAAKGVRQGDLLELDMMLLRRHWRPAVQCYADALVFARKELGVFCPDVVPAWSMILGLAGWLSVRPSTDPSLQHWFWGSAFTQVYAQAANTVVVADYDAIISNAQQPVIDKRMSDPFAALDEPARKNGLALRAMACFLAKNGALDPVSGRPLAESASIAVRAIDEDGALQKLTGETSFSRVVFVSKESDRKLNRIGGAPTSPLARDSYEEALLSQMVTSPNRARDISEFKAIVKDSYVWAEL